MENLYEFSDILAAPYEVFIDSSVNEKYAIQTHWHYYTELLCIISGSARITSDEKSEILEPGDIALLFPRSIHKIEHVEGHTSYYVLKFDISKLNFYGSFTPKLSSIIHSAAADKKLSPFFKSSLLENTGIYNEIKECLREFQAADYGYGIKLNGLICSLMITLIRIWKNNGLDTDKLLADSEDSSIYTITEYIDENIASLPPVSELSAMCNMSYSLFSREFKRLYGRSCKEYIEFIRVCKAEELIQFTNFDIAQIGSMLGFSDSSHFIKTFSKFKNITPKKFRSINRK